MVRPATHQRLRQRLQPRGRDRGSLKDSTNQRGRGGGSGSGHGGDKISDNVKKKWKNLRDCYAKYLRTEVVTHTGQERKHVDRYKTWPWVNQMEIFRPFLQFAQTSSNVSAPNNDIASQSQENSERGDAVNTDTILQNENMVSEDRPGDISRTNTPVSDTPRSYARTLKKFSPRRQAVTKFKIAQLLMVEELNQLMEVTNHETSYRHIPSTSSMQSYPMINSPISESSHTLVSNDSTGNDQNAAPLAALQLHFGYKRSNMGDFDTEKFIILIQEKQCIWNVSSEEYKNRDKRIDAWKEILEELHPDSNLWTPEERKIKVGLEKYCKEILVGELEEVSCESDSGSEIEDNIKVFLQSETEYCPSNDSDSDYGETKTKNETQTKNNVETFANKHEQISQKHSTPDETNNTEIPMLSSETEIALSSTNEISSIIKRYIFIAYFESKYVSYRTVPFLTCLTGHLREIFRVEVRYILHITYGVMSTTVAEGYIEDSINSKTAIAEKIFTSSSSSSSSVGVSQSQSTTATYIGNKETEIEQEQRMEINDENKMEQPIEMEDEEDRQYGGGYGQDLLDDNESLGISTDVDSLVTREVEDKNWQDAKNDEQSKDDQMAMWKKEREEEKVEKEKRRREKERKQEEKETRQKEEKERKQEEKERRREEKERRREEKERKQEEKERRREEKERRRKEEEERRHQEWMFMFNMINDQKEKCKSFYEDNKLEIIEVDKKIFTKLIDFNDARNIKPNVN
ncbi:hypothetical protein FQR65_LT16416 [Abscondita terminalis]|nr:hypothetical protein FQR65_LT16416 [Abscondita terminalis]